MNRREIRTRVLEAIERGEIPKGGPSELAAYELLDDVPASYWNKWSAGAAERIRRQVAETKCRCESSPDSTDDGRCGRCQGWRR